MVDITFPDHIARRLDEIARRENRPVPEVVESLLEGYESKTLPQEESDAAFEAIFGVYDDDVTDMSTSINETLKAYFENKHGRPD